MLNRLELFEMMLVFLVVMELLKLLWRTFALLGSIFGGDGKKTEKRSS